MQRKFIAAFAGFILLAGPLGRRKKLTPLLAALLAASPVQSQHAAPPPENTSLPDLAQPVSSQQTRLRPNANGIGVDSNDAFSRFTAHTETSQRTGTSVGVRGALTLTDAAALGAGVQMGGNTHELFVNFGLRLGNAQRLVFTGGQLRQKLEFAFPSGKTRADMTQNSAGASWRLNLGNGLLEYAEATAYAARTASRDLNDVSYAVDTAVLYELWNDPRRIAGGSLAGLQGKLGLRPWDGGRASFGLGQERLRYDLLGGAENHNRATGSLGLEQAIDGRTRLKFGADAAAAQNRVSLGVDHRFGDIGTLGLDVVNIHGRDSAPNDNRVQLSWTIPLGKGAGASPAIAPMAGPSDAPRAAAMGMRADNPDSPRAGLGSDGLLDQVAARPTWMPSQVIAKRDTTAAPTRLIAIDKAALPAGSSVDTATGIVTTPLGVAVVSIAGVTRNGGAFANAGQFALSGNSLVINPSLITQPAVGVTDVYVVTANNAGGGTTLITVNVSRGSVKIDSIAVTNGAPAASAPTASAVSIAGTAQVGQTLTGSYTYADANGDAQGVSTFRWLRNGVAIGGATASTYTLVAADVGNAITFEVTPVATVVPMIGTAVVSGATAVVLPAGYVYQGGLTWMPNNIMPPNGWTNWANANAYCSGTTILGQTGWRLPTFAELNALYASGAITGQGWASNTWSATPNGAGFHYGFGLSNGFDSWYSDGVGLYVSCVR